MSSYHFDLGFIWAHLPALLKGLELTVLVSVIGIAGALLAGVCGGAARSERVPGIAHFFVGWVEVIRNTPHLVQIFFLYFALPVVGLRLSGFWVACISLILWGTAYNVENFRAAFDAVPDRYVQAARALGFGRWQTFLQITLPTGLRIAIPSVTNTCISVLKGSSLMVAIGLPELTQTAVSIVSLTFRVFEMFAAIGVCYLVLVWTLSVVAHALERRLAVPGAGPESGAWMRGLKSRFALLRG